MIGLWLVRWSEMNISSATATSDSRMISAVNASIEDRSPMITPPCTSTRLPILSAVSDWPGWTTVVAAGSSTMAGPSSVVAGEPVTPQDHRVVDAVLAEIHCSVPLHCLARINRRGEGGEIRCGQTDEPGDVERHDLDGSLEREEIGHLVAVTETPNRLVQSSVVAWEGYPHGVLLSPIPHVRGRSNTTSPAAMPSPGKKATASCSSPPKMCWISGGPPPPL